ncbi:hypothetical protein AVEN_189581-1 [Araneus ventricosus]|uniref:Histone-lysine N-methyltransferase SETMAR n=1 Tax=Araneus ventricosus TaxID=182803 RepID=A0A4Y2NP81_ARAVE|nr:hypothetical protein AVEN_189581-1 [Araneus ventricosus]
MNEASVRKLCLMFNQRRNSVHNNVLSGWPSLIMDKLKAKVENKIQENQSFTLSTLHDSFPQISQSLLLEIVTEHLGRKKMCARWVPKNLTDVHKTKRMGAALEFLTQYHNDSDEFLNCIVMGDETWVSYKTGKTSISLWSGITQTRPQNPKKKKQISTPEK